MELNFETTGLFGSSTILSGLRRRLRDAGGRVPEDLQGSGHVLRLAQHHGHQGTVEIGKCTGRFWMPRSKIITKNPFKRYN